MNDNSGQTFLSFLIGFIVGGLIGAAVAFSNKILPALFLMQMSFLEDWLLEICQVVAGQEEISYDFEQSDRFIIEQARTFFEQKLLVRFPDPWPAWETLLEFQSLRDGAVNKTGLEVGRIQDSFLVVFDATFEGQGGRVLIINKQNIIWASPED